MRPKFFRLMPLIFAAGVVALTSEPGLAAEFGVLLPACIPVAAAEDVDARQESIHERLRDAIEAGRITDAHKHQIRDELDKVSDREAGFKSKDGELTTWETMELHFDLDRISKELEAYLTCRKGCPGDLVNVRNLLARRLNDALASQRLTQGEFDNFNGELQKVDKEIADVKDANGLIPTNDQTRIALDIDNLSQRFTAAEHQRQADMSAIDKRKDEMRDMIRHGVPTGQLTEDEVDDLRQQLYNYEAKEERVRKAGPLSADEQLSMALELERFGAEIRARMDNGVNARIDDKTVDFRRTALDSTFATALFAGDLTEAEAQNFRNSLEKIGGNETALRAQGGGQLTTQQIQDLLIEIEKLKGSFSRLTYNRAKVWTGVDGLVTNLKQKIAVAEAANKLSGEESDDLQSKIADVLVAKSGDRSVQGYGRTEVALTLSAEIEALDTELDRKVAAHAAADLTPAGAAADKAATKAASDHAAGYAAADRASVRGAASHATGYDTAVERADVKTKAPMKNNAREASSQ